MYVCICVDIQLYASGEEFETSFGIYVYIYAVYVYIYAVNVYIYAVYVYIYAVYVWQDVKILEISMNMFPIAAK